MKEPLVSVILTSYQHYHYIDKTIDSILNQTYKKIELCVSDNGSQDGSAELIKSYKDDRIKSHFFKENQGVVINFRKSLSMATGKYFSFSGSDDYYDLTKIEKQVKILEDNPELGAVFSYVQVIDADGNKIEDQNAELSRITNHPYKSRGDYLKRFFFEGTVLNFQSVLIHADLYNDIQDTSSFLYIYTDYYLWTQLIKRKPIQMIEEKLVYYRAHSGAISRTATPMSLSHLINDAYMIMSDYFDDMPINLFYEGFGDMLIKKGDLNSDEVNSEIIYLYLQNNHKNFKNACRASAFHKICSLKHVKSFLHTLVNEYYFTENDIDSLKINLFISDIKSIGKYNDVVDTKRFTKTFDYLMNPYNRVGIYLTDVDIALRYFNFLARNKPDQFNNIKCMVIDNNSIPIINRDLLLNTLQYNLNKMQMKIPVVNIKQAFHEYGVNVLMIISYDLNNELINDIESILNDPKIKKNNVRVIKLISENEYLYEL